MVSFNQTPLSRTISGSPQVITAAVPDEFWENVLCRASFVSDTTAGYLIVSGFIIDFIRKKGLTC